jgi:AbrB family looped-hinge helix DNA binding protein
MNKKKITSDDQPYSTVGTVSPKYQITIPKVIRDVLELRSGAKLTFTLREDYVLEIREKAVAKKRVV